jgi:chromosome segregation ATPase
MLLEERMRLLVRQSANPALANVSNENRGSEKEEPGGWQKSVESRLGPVQRPVSCSSPTRAPLTNSRAQANTLVVPERQQLETLRREKKTLTDALASVQDKIQQAETKQAQLQSEIDRLSEREEEVS